MSMKFCEYRSGWEVFKQSGLNREFGWENDLEAAHWMRKTGQFRDDPIAYRHMLFTINWRTLGSPYYDVYPGIVPMLQKISLEFPGEAIPLPAGLTDLFLRLPEDGKHCLKDDETTIRGLFLSFQPCNRQAGVDQLEPGLVVGMDVGETIPLMQWEYPLFTMRIFPLDERNVEETLGSLPKHPSYQIGKQMSDELVVRCVKVGIAVCMLGDDPEILEPQVLKRDEGKEITPDLIGKARRRGKFGFSLGRHIEMIPHIRRPHPALMWTGKGRTVPRIVFRKGSVIHREVVEKIPTGKGQG